MTSVAQCPLKNLKCPLEKQEACHIMVSLTISDLGITLFPLEVHGGHTFDELPQDKFSWRSKVWTTVKMC